MLIKATIDVDLWVDLEDVTTDTAQSEVTLRLADNGFSNIDITWLDVDGFTVIGQ